MNPSTSAVPTISSSRTAAAATAPASTSRATLAELRRPFLLLAVLLRAACAASMPLREKACLRPSAAASVVLSISSGSAARRRANGMPMTSLSATAVPCGASSSSDSSSSCRRHTQQSGSPLATLKPASGALRRSMTEARRRASST